MALSIRWLRLKDAPHIYAVERSVFGANGWSAREFLRRFDSGTHNGVGVWVGDMLAGYLIADARDTGIGVLESVAVLQPVRRQGLATLMLEKLADSALCAAMGEWRARVHEADVAAHHWLKSMGFACSHIEHRLDEPDYYHFVRPEPLPMKVKRASNKRSSKKCQRADSDNGESLAGAPAD